ncbi:hypothetical protein CH63R_07141 [Colletotrichum higginsianum IMI 349063]|uniref:Uncharacterized protein n=1 Tax=Colletotrichum higginsianum (strain IMI 349063) TaxID=759273 RepID=A0A1B7Y8L3_COLHI|nr:hypothetical protein CH63R_07141 [Colletotrichum higginsianum IMI 349063]OBR08376.1 hypothetical protein CH63R_07141 [Colletotrichum higginsianum IMI 349063]
MSGDPTVEEEALKRISRQAFWAGARVRGTQTLGDGKGRGHLCQPFLTPLDSPSVPAARGWQMDGTEAELRPNLELELNVCQHFNPTHAPDGLGTRDASIQWDGVDGSLFGTPKGNRPNLDSTRAVENAAGLAENWRRPPRCAAGECRFVSSIGFWRQGGLHPNRYDTMRDGFGPREENSVKASGASHDCKPSAALGLRLVKGTWRHGARLSSIDARPGRFSRNRLPPVIPVSDGLLVLVALFS